MEENMVKTIRLVIQYLRRKCTPEETREMMRLLTQFNIGMGTKAVFHYTVMVGTDTLKRRYHVACPNCGKSTIYLFSDFGPGCSGMDGGCGYKVPKEKRPWYEPPNDANRGSAPQSAQKKK